MGLTSMGSPRGMAISEEHLRVTNIHISVIEDAHHSADEPGSKNASA